MDYIDKIKEVAAALAAVKVNACWLLVLTYEF